MDLTAVVSAGVSLTICVFTIYKSYKNSRAIEVLKAQLKSKSDKDEAIFNLLMGIEAQHITHYIQMSRDYLVSVQQMKDEIRILLANWNNSFTEDRNQTISRLREKIINSFSTLYPTLTDKPEIKSISHTIKKIYLENILIQLGNIHVNESGLQSQLETISKLQIKLADCVRQEFDKIIQKTSALNQDI